MDYSIEYELTLKDFRTFAKRGAFRQDERTKRLVLGFALAAGVLVMASFGVIDVLWPGWLHPGSWLFGFGTYVLIAATTSVAGRRAMDPLADGVILGRKRLEVSDECVRLVGDGHESRYEWRKARRVGQAAGCVFVMYDRTASLIVPNRAFPDAAERDRFVAEATDRLETARPAWP